MSVGDTYSIITSISDSAYLTIQPAAGIEYIITKACSTNSIGSTPNISYNARAEIYNGTIISNIANIDNNPEYWSYWKIYITNAIYLRIYNLAGSSVNISVQGLQTK